MRNRTEARNFSFYEYGKFILAAVAVAFLFLAVLFLLPGRTAEAKDTSKTVYQIHSVSIEEGDSLWSIAAEYYTEDFSSINAYISEIKRMNGLKTDTIYAGGYILVPQYVSVR